MPPEASPPIIGETVEVDEKAAVGYRTTVAPGGRNRRGHKQRPGIHDRGERDDPRPDHDRIGAPHPRR